MRPTPKRTKIKNNLGLGDFIFAKIINDFYLINTPIFPENNPHKVELPQTADRSSVAGFPAV